MLGQFGAVCGTSPCPAALGLVPHPSVSHMRTSGPCGPPHTQAYALHKQLGQFGVTAMHKHMTSKKQYTFNHLATWVLVFYHLGECGEWRLLVELEANKPGQKVAPGKWFQMSCFLY